MKSKAWGKERERKEGEGGGSFIIEDNGHNATWAPAFNWD